MTAASATATFAFRASLCLLLALGIIARPALSLASELHGMAHAASAGHAHAHHDDHDPHVHDGAHDDAPHGHGQHVDDRAPRDHRTHDHPAQVAGAPAHAAPGDHAHPAAGHDPDHATGSHGLLHHADAGFPAGLPMSHMLPEAFGAPVMLLSGEWVSVRPQHAPTHFRPPIA